uniref:EF-hand domain-containing protein n=1 Tax=Chlamydomonas euryale TaxID=1486919 RepID=A0A7R9V5W6_9CHLO|mmetsp:Transcript_20932/g.62609  ORF Transcript_20932/g.62609 Transcript_20932/m.62609 type:complete len:143 (+) Transcript_20932:143-571(+)
MHLDAPAVQPLTRPLHAQMVRAFDTRGSRSLNVQEFQKLHEFLNSVTASFNYFDADRSRALTLSETVNALRHAGFNMDPPVVQAMFKRHDPNNSGTLSLDEYIRLCLFLQSCVRTFSAFDAQRAGRITLDFNQFVYAGSHIA